MAEIRIHPDGSAVVRIPASEASRLPQSGGTKKARVISTKNGILIELRHKRSKKERAMRAYEIGARRYDKTMRDLAK